MEAHDSGGQSAPSVGTMQQWPLTVTSLLDHAARWHAQQVVTCRTVEGPLTHTTYRQLHIRCQLLALALRDFGVRNQNCVGTIMWNTTRHLEAWYGIAGMGAICHTINPRLFAKDVIYLADNAEDKVIIFDLTFLKLVESLASELKTVKAFILATDRQHMPRSSSIPNLYCYEELLEKQRPYLPFHWTVTDELSACGACYTSGTTGQPKGVFYTHRSNYLTGLSVALPDGLAVDTSSRILLIVPMFHANGWAIPFAAVAAGARLVLPGPAMDGPSVYDLLEHQKCNSTAAVPTVWNGLLLHMQEHNLRLSHLKICVIGGSAAPLSMIKAFQEEYGVEVRHLWGMTETSPIATYNTPKGPMLPMTREQDYSFRVKQGWPHFLNDMRVVDNEGQELPCNGTDQGALQIRGHNIVGQYHKLSSGGANAEGWFDTGDIATIDEWGYMEIRDRSKDVIKSGGEWISSVIIENVAVAHPEVFEAAVIGKPHKKWVERPLLIIVPAPGRQPTKESILGFLKGKIATWWMPDDVVFVEAIPHTGSGKISKLDLRKQLAHVQLRESKL
ncbi:hypothetical protein WJX74_000674 [Apatococcus lobatus]|uniref:Uncharacterized protein n=2 Tax=Apatococcus TaxID=904362 RepID=A0AAW1SUD4_9CHLO